MRRLALAVLLTGCGRLSFDQAPAGSGDGGGLDDGMTRDGGGPIGHDEDGDGLGDATDPCPHLAALIPDSDGDGVGDDCDPEPQIARQQIVLFVTMTPESGPSDQSGAWVQNADSQSFAGTGFATMSVTKSFNTGRVVVGLDIEQQVGTPFQHQVAFGGGIAGTGTSYFGEVKQQMGMQAISQITLENNASFAGQGSTPIGGAIPLGPAQLTLDYRGTTQVATEAILGGTPYAVNVAAPLYAGIDYFSVSINDVQLTLRYVLVIRSD